MPDDYTTGKALKLIHEESPEALQLVGDIMEYNQRCTANSYDQLYQSWLDQNREIVELQRELRQMRYKLGVVEEFFSLFAERRDDTWQ